MMNKRVKFAHFFLGLFFILTAILLLVQALYGSFPKDIWAWIWMTLFSIFALVSLWERRWLRSLVFCYIVFLIANATYYFLALSTSVLFLVGLLFFLGLRIIFGFPNKSARRQAFMHHRNRGGFVNVENAGHQFETSFASSSRYINEPDFRSASAQVNSGKSTIYFDNAIIKEDSATFDVNISFGEMILYVPQEWSVIVKVETILGSVEEPTDKAATTKEKTFYISGHIKFGNLIIRYL